MKKNQKDKDFILKDKTMGLLMRLSYPLVLGNIIATFYTLADGIWLAKLSTRQFTATSFTWPVVFLFISVAIGISIAGTALISRAIGSGDRDRASNYATHLVLISLVVGVFFSVLGYIVSPKIIELMGAKGDLYKFSVIYLRVNAVGFIVDNLYFCFQAILNAQGKTKETTIMGVVSGVLNIVLDPIFIFPIIPFVGGVGLGWGIFGAAVATLIAKIIALTIGITKTFREKTYIDFNFRNFKYNPMITKNIVGMAIPTAVGRSSAALGFTVLNGFIMSYGENVVSAFSIVNRFTDLFMQMSMGIGAAMTSIIGQNLGAMKMDRVSDVIRDAKKLVWIISIGGMIGYYLYQDNILSIFIDTSSQVTIFEIAKEYLKFDILMIPFVGLFNIYQGLFQGVGKMKYSMHMSTGRLWFMRIPLILIFKNFTSIGRLGIWLAMFLSNLLIIVYCQYIYRKKNIFEVNNV